MQLSTMVVAQTSSTYIVPNLANQLYIAHDLPVAVCTLGFATAALTGGIFAPINGILAGKFGRPIVVSVCIFIQSVAILFMGPSTFFGMGNHLSLMFIGLGLMGIGVSGV